MQMKRWILGLLGAWLVLAGFLSLGATGYIWSGIIAGVLIALTSLFGRMGAWAWLATVAGVWAIVSAFVPALLTGYGAVWNNLIVGAVVVVSALALSSQEERKNRRGAAGGV